MDQMIPRDDNLRSPVKPDLNTETGFLVVQLSKAEYGYHDQPINFEGRVFQPKSELHITILSGDAADTLREHLQANPDDAARVQEFVDETRWSYRERNAFYHVQEEEGVESIIQMVEMPYMDDFFARVSEVLGQGLVLPPTHVTLYTRGNEKGIGLPTQNAFDRLVRREIGPKELFPRDNRSEQGTV